MTGKTYRLHKLADGEALYPKFRAMWRAIKAEAGTCARLPKSVTVTTEAQAAMPNDHDCCRRYAVLLDTGAVVDVVSVHAGEWACENHGQDKAIQGVPEGVALVTVTWNDFYHYCLMDIQVNPANLPAALPA